MLKLLVLMVLTCLFTLILDKKEVTLTNEDFEKRFYEAVWQIDSSNHSWVEKALANYRVQHSSYWDNYDAIAMLELLEEEVIYANNPDIRVLVKNFCYLN